MTTGGQYAVATERAGGDDRQNQTPGPSLNPFAEASRLTKAFNLATFLRRHGITSEAAKTMTEADWVLVSKAANVNLPSERSRLLTLAKLKALEEPLDQVA